MKPLFHLAWTAIIWAACPVSGTEVAPQTAAAVAKVWLSQPRPMGMPISTKTAAAIVRKDASGNTLYHVINLQPEGYVVVAGDDSAEPIIAFSASGQWALNTGGPLTAMLDKDMGHRVAQARVKQAAANLEMTAKWKALTPPSPTAGAPAAQVKALAVASISDVRVAPFVASTWSQTLNMAGVACFNYFTPPYGDGNNNNYPCGCVATAMAQVMRYFQYPTAGVGAGSYQISVDGSAQSKNLRGGNGSGGSYRWDLMPLASNSSDTSQTAAIGALLNDCGVAVHMQYAAQGSGAFGSDACAALNSVFQYRNAVNTSRFSSANISGTNLYTIINPNLDAGEPVMLSIENSSDGHEVVCDGYGYLNGTMYHHVNLGWQGTANAWYNLPTINTGVGVTFTLVDDCTYNIFTNATGEIISGRILDLSGNPVSGATVTATANGASTVIATTSAQGIYGLAGVASGTLYSLSASHAGFGIQTATATTGTSRSSSCGNVWGCNFTLSPTGVAQIKPSIVTSPVGVMVVAGSGVTLSVTAGGDGLVYQWSKNGSTISGATSSTYTIGAASVSDSGTYTATASNSRGTATSKGALVTVVTAPSITTQPGDHYAKMGASFTLSVSASGAGLSYQWTQNGVSVGNNSAKYTLAKAQAGDSGTYYVIITNIAGSVTSSPAVLTVLNPPLIVSAPAGGACPQGSNMTLSVSASGDQLSYQWKKGSAALSGATGTNYTITAAQKGDAGTYSVVVANPLVTVTASAAVTVVAPPVVNAPASITLMPGLTIALKGTATGTGRLGYQWSFNGSPIAGALTNAYTITNASQSAVGTYLLTVTNFGGSAQTSIAAGWSADTTPPTVSLSRSLGTVTNATLTIAGKASDNVAVSNVSYSLNGAGWVLASTTNHWTNWSAQLTLGTLGTNVLLLSALDVNTNASVTLTNYPVYAPLYNITINVTGVGKVTSSWKGSQIQYGKAYTATAVNGPSYVLKDWTGDIATNQASLSFVAASNLTLAANFVPNLFTNSGGAYNGLFIATNNASHTNIGFWSGTITTNLTYSSKVLLEGDTLALSGKFDTDGTLVQTVTRKGKSPLQLNLSMDFTNQQLVGTISADDWGSTLAADLAVYSKENKTTNAGAFTFVFPVSAPGLGYGGGQVTVSTNGIITLVGNAPDGTSLSQSVPLSKDGRWPLFVPIYTKGSANLGEVYGWLNFASGKPSGNVVWYRPAGISPYSNGFLDTNTLENSVFAAPTKAAPKALNFTVGLISFTGGGLSAPFSEIFLVANDGTIYTQGASKLKINAKGQISGSVTDPVNASSAKLVGTVLQSANVAKGSVLWTNQLGEFTIAVSP